MKILFASAEVDPFAKVGGLADVASALPRRLFEMGHDVRVITPCHASSLTAFHDGEAPVELMVNSPDGARRVGVATRTGTGGVPVQLVLDDKFFGRPAVYGEGDDLHRYQFFCRAVIETLRRDDWIPDILHINDWHTAPLAFALRNLAWGDRALRGIASVFAIHNLRYRGPDELNDMVCQAVYYSDMVTTVSPTYAREILTPEHGEGLDSLLQMRASAGALVGILNGLDYDLYNPRTDSHISRQFDLSSLEGRAANREALRTEFKLPPSSGPLAAMVTRLTEQKGIDLVLQTLPEILSSGGQLLVLGDGDEALTAELTRLQAEHPDSVRLAARFDDGLARQIYAGCDVVLMPSRFEPCGLGQLMAMRYGAVPIGRRTGGIADTVLDAADHGEHATGFLFDDFNSSAFAAAFERAVVAFHRQDVWQGLQLNGMSRDYSWGASASRYVEVYLAALRSRGIVPLE